jgi:hypothetical protein
VTVKRYGLSTNVAIAWRSRCSDSVTAMPRQYRRAAHRRHRCVASPSDAPSRRVFPYRARGV